MVKQLVLLIFFSIFAFGDQIEIQADNFYADENTGKSTLSGNVTIKQGSDILSSDKVIIYMDKNRKPLRYEAINNANFSLNLKGKLYKGSGDKFVYNVNQDTYEINGNAFIHEINTDKKLYGEKIVVDRKNNVYSVQSKDKKPARLVFDVEQQ
ncbi:MULTISPECIES: lipopolysaccharide transport periplasmic protein LptA [unclassified Campylobacter]|uniref:lipopolysaccharide transport periplasmic protein LptA n=1 Tax=unclassified Campylobacter TaxID=2593542 RepID=UPI0012381F96|nr:MULTISPECIES: lipopolysaccharide transport periplasmic protein LptA [unclassified Campylobacter]KAA6226420.1 lipopolysaccharide transport periplasmic protein LptA [Campylobacter sp. LR286c]KAA6226542.1 lipopolysaccharide transport periplasmic protein LptA [Campylobacter sp. LR185c]KAA6226908.1 lipopolysaccharide transport periplasmic protein LptA [Campylobacter sp. LR196d]KAA6233652.1 lipopolysaccharide transport periplasmic protein LptA [Campylobacter sp. LR291e]KAA8603651.1 lipopolysaccha